MVSQRIYLSGLIVLLLTMVACVYAEPPRRAYRYADHDRDRGRAYGSDHLFATAQDIERLAGRLEHNAKDDQHRLRDIHDEDVDRIKRVNDAAEKFWDQVKKYHGDLSHVDEEYRSLANRLSDASRVIGYFSDEVRADYERLWSMVQDLSYIQADAERRRHEHH